MFGTAAQTVNFTMGRWLTIRQGVAGLIAPPVCALCGGPGQWRNEPWGLDLCVHCEAACPRASPGSLPFADTFCLFRYADPVDQMVTRLKFGHDLVFARTLGILLAAGIKASGRQLPECIVPLPLHRSRYRERGFCQTTEIAWHVCRRLRDAQGRPLSLRADLLRRVRATRPQSSLDAAQRAHNLLGAFEPCNHQPPPRHAALLDDVMTTGHTAAAAVAALASAGVAKVEVWCCARA